MYACCCPSLLSAVSHARSYLFFFLLLSEPLSLALAACSDTEHAPPEAVEQALEEVEETVTEVAAQADENPFFEISTLPNQMPPFDRIADEHFVPAMERGMEEHL